MAAVDKGSGKSEKITITNDKGEWMGGLGVASAGAAHEATLTHGGKQPFAPCLAPWHAPLHTHTYTLTHANPPPHPHQPATAGRLSQEDIDRMVSEAEEFAEQDKKVKARIDARNQLETYCYNMKQSVGDKLKEKLEAGEVETVEKAAQGALDWMDENQVRRWGMLCDWGWVMG